MNVLAIVNKIGKRYARSVKTYAMYALWRIGLKQWCRHAPLYQLRRQLVSWNTQRLNTMGAAAALNMQDISHIRQLIEQAQQKAKTEISPTLLDQWFFQAIGAIRVQAQTGVDAAWYLFDQSVHEQLGGQSFSRSLSLGLMVTLSVVWMSMVTPIQPPVYTDASPLREEAPYESGKTADPVTLSLFNLAYQKMQNGSCQLPQAAMLPDAQRQAFIMFVTKGKVDVDRVEQLRQALGYVSCLYPQELMHPQTLMHPQGRERL